LRALSQLERSLVETDPLSFSFGPAPRAPLWGVVAALLAAMPVAFADPYDGQAEWAQRYDAAERLTVSRSTTPILSARRRGDRGGDPAISRDRRQWRLAQPCRPACSCGSVPMEPWFRRCASG